MKKNKVRVLLCSQSPSNNGGVRVWCGTVLSYFKEHTKIDDISIKIDLFSTTRSVSMTNLLPWYIKLYVDIKDFWFKPFKLFFQLTRYDYDIFHMVSVGGQGLIRDILFVYICRLFKVKTIIHFHFGRIPEILKKNDIESYLFKKVIRIADRIIVLDQKSKNALIPFYDKKVIKLGNPFSDDLLNICVSQEKRIKRKIIFVGHMVKTKGIMELLEACYDIEGISLYIYGPSNAQEEADVNQFIIKHPFKGEINICGLKPLNIIYEEMCSADLFVLPTYTEGFPYVIMEAMACGCPIISTPVGAIEEMLTSDEGLLGYLVPVKDSHSLKERILYCLANRNETLLLGEKARKKALNCFSSDVMMKKLFSQYLKVINC